ncbi:DUF1697 domain-containing protein [Flavobacterium sp.]|uniref:DUF1697 domain-containing protein n=1 Tax=Flavobacterium sp. TaxID=239 RepID=UPI0025BED63C|nr:DUF1697 domain-containing protein [Flavobacterium sp.]
MKKYIALLRGINVSGHHVIKMEALRPALVELGLSNVSTYIQSGNILFESDDSPAKLEMIIKNKIFQKFGFDVATFVLTPDELKTALADNPFAAKTPEDSVQPYVGFMSAIPDVTNVAVMKSQDFRGDEFHVIDKRIYLWYADSAGNTKLSNAVFEKKLNIKATSRNWKTIKKLIELSSEY